MKTKTPWYLKRDADILRLVTGDGHQIPFDTNNAAKVIDIVRQHNKEIRDDEEEDGHTYRIKSIDRESGKVVVESDKDIQGFTVTPGTAATLHVGDGILIERPVTSWRSIGRTGPRESPVTSKLTERGDAWEKKDVEDFVKSLRRIIDERAEREEIKQIAKDAVNAVRIAKKLPKPYPDKQTAEEWRSACAKIIAEEISLAREKRLNDIGQ